MQEKGGNEYLFSSEKLELLFSSKQISTKRIINKKGSLKLPFC